MTTLLGNVSGIDVRGHNVLLDDGGAVPYDSLIIAHRARGTPTSGTTSGRSSRRASRRSRMRPRSAASCCWRSSMPSARPSPRRARRCSPSSSSAPGPTGVELAGAIIELARDTLKAEFRTIEPDEARVVLIEAGDRVLGNFDPELSAYALKALQKLGVQVELGRPVTAVTDKAVLFGDRRLWARTVIWAAGVQSSPAAQWLGVAADRAGRVKVEPDLTVPGHPEIFVVGDAATILGAQRQACPWRRRRGQAGRPARGRRSSRRGWPTTAGSCRSRYKHAGDLATIGKRAAVIDFGWIKLRGWIAWWAWGFAHIYFLIGVRNRLFVALAWLWIYLFGQRGARLITQGDAQQQASKPPS